MDKSNDVGTTHEKLDASLNKLICPDCSEQFENESQYQDHLKIHEGKKLYGRKVLECSLCEKKYKRKDYLIRHISKHQVSSLICKFCSKKYASKAHLKKHELAHTECTFCCRYCEKSFASEEERKEHKKMEHQKTCVCSSCKSRFYTEESLEKHKKLFCSHEINQFVCENCGKQFKLKGNLKVHNESKCGTERTYKCEVCKKSFMTRPSLATHHLLHTGEKKFVCRFCGKSHRTKGEVQRHELTHTRDKPFVCKVCLKAFAHRESLITHSTLHTGIKPYICDGCGKGFSCVGNLIKHRKNHAKCMTSDSKRNQPRIKKPTVHSLLINSADLEVCQDKEIPFTTVGPYIPEQSSNSHLTSPQHNAHDNLTSSISKPITYLDPPGKCPDQPHCMLEELPKTQLDELDVDRKWLTDDSRINNVNDENAERKNFDGLWGINSRLCHTNSTQSELANYKPETKLPLKASPTQRTTYGNVGGETTQKQHLNPTYSQDAFQPFFFVGMSRRLNNESENATTLQSKCAPSKSLFFKAVDENRLDESSNSILVKEEDSRDEPHAVECDFMVNDSADSSDSSSVSVNISVKIGERKLEKSLYEDHYMSWVKSGNGVLDDCVELKEAVVNPTTLSERVKNRKDGIFTCKTCRKCFREEERLLWHMKTHDSRFVDNKKNEVGYISEDDEPLGIRLQRHNVMLRANQEFPCQYCYENFENEGDYKRHRRKHHKGAEKVTFPCPHCPKVYKFRRALLRHEPRHTGGTFHCKKCDRTFKIFKEYQLHLRTLHWKKFNCDECGHSFQSSTELNSHIICNHGTGEKNLSCHTCGKLFKHNVNLKKHIESRCGVSPRYVCKTCGKSYLSQGGFESHQLTHTGLRVFLCKYCGRDFQHKSVLLIHELTHTGEKPFICPICSKAFAHQISLTTHSTIHTGVKPYKCEGCGSGFSCFGNLKKHRLTHMSTCSLTRIRKSK